MILKGSQRGGSKQLAAHLLKTVDNEHVEVHELRGFTGNDLNAALHEIYAVSRGTRAKQFLFSLSLNPPAHEKASIDTFEKAIETIEQKLGLSGQPRAVVFHEKDGRRHAHVVWSRIDTDRMKAINLPHYKLKLRDVSRQLYLEHNWRMPRGLANSKERDPKNFTRAEWEQAKRGGKDAKALKAMFQECWAISDSRQAFVHALNARGYHLARGDRRGHVAVDYRGETYAIAKWSGLKNKDVRSKLGDANELPGIEDVKMEVASRMTDVLRGFVAKAEIAHQKKAASLALRKSQIVARQRKERSDLDEAQQKRWAIETAARTKRLSKGVRGLFDRLTGKYGRQARANELEAMQGLNRDRAEKDGMIERHLEERQAFHQLAKQVRTAHEKDVAELHRDVAGYIQSGSFERLNVNEHFRDASRGGKTTHSRSTNDSGPIRSR